MSSLRKQGPITTDLRCWAKASDKRLSIQPTRRRDELRSRGGPCSCAQLRTRQGRPRWAISNTPSPPRGAVSARVVHEPWPSEIRGRRECRARRAHPQPRVQSKKAHELVTAGRRSARHSPRNGFNGFLRALPGDRASLSPSSVRCASIVTHLTPASGRQDHTISPSASNAFVCRAKASTASRAQRFVTIAKRPSKGGGMRIAIFLCLPRRQEKFGKSEISYDSSKIRPTCSSS